MSENLPIGWAICSIDKITSNIEQREPKAGKPFSYIDISAIDRETKKIVSPQRLDGADAPSRARKIVKEGDVLVSMTRPNLNAVAMVGKDLDGEIASTGFDVLRAIEIDPRWLHYIVRSPAFVEAMTDLVQGALYPAIKSTDVRRYQIPLAPIPEQKRIADKLDTVLARVDACRERLNRVPLILKRFRQSVLAAATSGQLTADWREVRIANSNSSLETMRTAKDELADYLESRKELEKKEPPQPDLTYWTLAEPTTWVICSVNQFAECLDRMRVPIKRENRSNANGHFPYYGANGEVSRIDEFIFDDELVLVTEDETFYGREKPIAYRSSGKCWVNNHAHVLKPKTKIAADYLCYALMYYDVIPWLSGTTGRAKLTQAALNALPIAMPPALEMAEIVRRVETLFAFADRLEARLATARTATDRLTPALLAKAFRGELVPQDPNDEPAAELLKRLAAARTATSDKPRRGRAAKVEKRPSDHPGQVAIAEI